MSHYEESLKKMLAVANINIKSSYKPGEIQKLLSMSNSTFQVICDEWEPAHIANGITRGLESYRIGNERRVPYHALVEWLGRNSSYELEMKG